MKPAVAFIDPTKIVADYLRTQFTDVPVFVQIVGKPPPSALQVRPDGPSQLRYPVSAESPVRVIAWAPDEFAARALASRALTILATFPGNDSARGFANPTGPDVATDPVSNRDLAYIIVTVRQRPVAV